MDVNILFVLSMAFTIFSPPTTKTRKSSKKRIYFFNTVQRRKAHFLLLHSADNEEKEARWRRGRAREGGDVRGHPSIDIERRNPTG